MERRRGEAATRPPRAATSARAVALVVATILCLGAVTGTALAVGRASLGAAMDQRLEERADLLRRFQTTLAEARSTDSTFPRKVREMAFSPTDTATNVVMLGSYVSNRGGDSVRATMVVRHDGTLAGSTPEGDPPPPADLDDALAASAAGEIGISPVFELDGAWYWAWTYPVGGDDLWGSLVLVEPATHGSAQGTYERLGAFGEGDGGLTLLDPQGAAAASWDPARLGTRPFSDEERRRLTTTPRVWRAEVDGETVVHIGVGDPDRVDGTSLVFEQAEDALFGDLRDAQRQRDLTVVAVAVVAVFILAGFSTLRRRAVRRSEARVDLLMRNAHDIVLEVDAEGRLTFVSPAAATMLDQDPAEWVGRRMTDLVADDHAPRVAAAVVAAHDTGASSLLGVRLRAGDGTFRWFDMVLADRRDDHLTGVLVTCQEVGERKEMEDQLAYRATHDVLTGLANRSAFEDRLAELAGTDRPIGVMVIDLDRFKQLNDTLGHAAGDTALQAVAEGLARAVRPGDLVGRLGGDEFGVVVADATRAVVESVAERIGVAVRSAWPVVDASSGIDASIGVALAHGPFEAPELIVRDADAAMYDAKRAGGGRAVVTVVAPQPEDATSTPVGPRPAQGTAPSTATTGTAEDAERAERAEATGPTDVPPASTPPRPSVRDRARSAGVVLVAVGIVAGVAAVGVVQSDRAQTAAEERRIADRGALMENISASTTATSDPELLLPIMAALPWDPGSQALMDLIAREIASAPVLGETGMSAALDRDGNVLAVHPAGTRVALDTDDPRWAAALTGKAYAPEIAHDGERQRFYLVVPVVRADGSVEIVAVMGADTAESDWSSTQMGLGAMGPGTGGSSTVDANGRAVTSWRPGAVGTVLIDPAELEDVEAGDVAVRRGVVDGEEHVTLVSRVPGTSSVRYTIWQQSADDLFGDLRVGQTARDVAVFGLLAVAVLALAVTNRRRELALRRNAARLDALLRQAHDLVLVVGDDGSVYYASAAVEHLFEVRSTDVVGRPLAELVGDDAVAALREESRSRYEAGDERGVTLRDLAVVGPHGHQRLFDIDGVDLRHLKEVGGYLLTFHEISERVELQERLTAQATSDPLTGLANRAQFAVHLDRLAAERRHRSGDHAVVFVDLDHFKPVNDRYGHQAGDELLRTIAERLSATVRATDVVCRLGGDEFAILLADCNEEQARVKVEQLLGAVREPVAVGDDLVTVDASIGVALSRSTITHPEQLVREADQAMYRAKRAGRGQIVVDA